MINDAVAGMQPDQAYLNVGVWQGFTLLAGMIGNPQKTCIVVDNFSEFDAPRDEFMQRFKQHRSPEHHFYEVDYKEYFQRAHHGPIGVYVYDASHSYADQLMNLQLAEPFIAKGAKLLVDDTNERDPRQATLDFVRQSDSHYRILLDESTLNNGHPTFWNGIMVIQKES